MVSYHDVWSKGRAMLAVGLQVKLLHGSLAMELSTGGDWRSNSNPLRKKRIQTPQFHRRVTGP